MSEQITRRDWVRTVGKADATADSLRLTAVMQQAKARVSP